MAHRMKSEQQRIWSDAYTSLTGSRKSRKMLLRGKLSRCYDSRGLARSISKAAIIASGIRMRLLVVEDNPELAQLLAKGLNAAGFEVDSATTADDARTALMTTRYSSIVLDLGLPDDDGLSILQEIRGKKDPVPVLILTARSTANDRVKGLRSGADDYLVKPFAFEELVARLEAILRRPSQLVGSSLQLGNLVFDTASRQAFIQDEPQYLSSRETAVLELLIRRKGHVVSKRLIEDELFGLFNEIASNAIEVYIHRLRKQLLEHGATVQIHTIRGVGYLLAEA
jgi:DNA-binding response OmpR family regulator